MAQDTVKQVEATVADGEQTVQPALPALPDVGQLTELVEPLTQPIPDVTQPVVQVVDELVPAATSDALTQSTGSHTGAHHVTPAANVEQPIEAPSSPAIDEAQPASDVPSVADAAVPSDVDVTLLASDVNPPAAQAPSTEEPSLAPAAPLHEVIAERAAPPPSPIGTEAPTLETAVTQASTDPVADWAELPPSTTLATASQAPNQTHALSAAPIHAASPLRTVVRPFAPGFMGLEPRIELPSVIPFSSSPAPRTLPGEAPGGAAPPAAGAAGGALLAGAGPPGTAAAFVAALLLAATWRALWLVARLRPVGISLLNLAPPG